MFRQIPKHILIPLVTLVMGLFFGSALQIALAWTVPSAVPPGNNVAPPLNTSAVDQTKTGSLTVNGAGERMQAPRFIDNDNTNFFLDPNSSSKLSFATFDNLESLGFVSANRMVASAYMQAPVFYDNNNINYKLDPNGNSQLNSVYANNWFRAQGDAGFYFQDHGGGWQMWDNTWIRAVGDKAIYSGGDICTNAGGWKCLSSMPTAVGLSCYIAYGWGHYATCAAGYYATGGGCNGNGTNGPFTMISIPSGARSWYACCGNTFQPACAVDTHIYAKCCK